MRHTTYLYDGADKASNSYMQTVYFSGSRELTGKLGKIKEFLQEMARDEYDKAWQERHTV